MELSSARILVVEPDDHDYRVTRSLLREQRMPKFSVARARDLREATDMVNKQAPDVVLVEVSGEGRDCFLAIEALRAAAESVPVIVFSSFADAEIGETAIRHGADDCILKGDTDSKTLAKSILFALSRRSRLSPMTHSLSTADFNEALEQASLFNFAPSPIIGREVSGTIRAWNSGARAMFGWTAQEAIGKNLHDLLQTEARWALPDIEQTLLRNGTWAGQFRHTHKDGSVIYTQVKLLVQRDGWGKPVGIIEHYADISQQKLLEQMLREGETLFRNFCESVDTVMYFASLDISQCFYINNVYEQLWGRTCMSLYKNPLSFLDSVHADDAEALMRLLASRKGCGHLDAEYRIVQPDGTIKVIWDHGFPVLDAAGNIMRICGYAQDVTARLQRLKSIEFSA